MSPRDELTRDERDTIARALGLPIWRAFELRDVPMEAAERLCELLGEEHLRLTLASQNSDKPGCPTLLQGFITPAGLELLRAHDRTLSEDRLWQVGDRAECIDGADGTFPGGPRRGEVATVNRIYRAQSSRSGTLETYLYFLNHPAVAHLASRFRRVPQ